MTSTNWDLILGIVSQCATLEAMDHEHQDQIGWSWEGANWTEQTKGLGHGAENDQQNYWTYFSAVFLDTACVQSYWIASSPTGGKSTYFDQLQGPGAPHLHLRPTILDVLPSSCESNTMRTGSGVSGGNRDIIFKLNSPCIWVRGVSCWGKALYTVVVKFQKSKWNIVPTPFASNSLCLLPTLSAVFMAAGLSQLFWLWPSGCHWRKAPAPWEASAGSIRLAACQLGPS